eukprot:CAMPEP_0194265130 /NCGR_PEP_ID=MMETSP0169-20130528/467_1 /TAXON_ID=218684 /ORGANISM="Corethron pennatum, Strain L29A3" /LENGTH=299 /DNA_ID=CAMNT_0039005537 /DNA_START=125 /DNA_END=1024 /DNA_ORIENTATION=+
MILSKVSIFFTTLAVATLSAKSAEVISSDVMVERDTRTLKKRGKKGKKGGSASPVYIKSKKKGNKSISTASPSDPITASPSYPLTASPTGICEQNAFPFIAYQIDFDIDSYADLRETFDNDELLSTVPEVFITLDMAVSLNNDVQSIFFGDDTGCDYNDSLALYYAETMSPIIAALPSVRNLHENTRDRGRELQLGVEEIIALGRSAIFILLVSCVFYDNLNKLYPPAMGKLDEIACGYYAAGKGVVAIISALSEGSVDLTIYMEDTLGEVLQLWEGDIFFPTVIGAAPTAFDNTPCNL